MRRVGAPGAPGHRGAGEDVLRDGVLHEPLRSNDRHASRVDVGLADDALDTAEVVACEWV
jgi:hypothetical protein